MGNPIHGTDSTAGATAPAVPVSADWIAWTERDDPPLYRVALWPYRSLGRQGQRCVLWIAAAGVAVPLAASIGTMAFWGLLPFCLGAVSVLHLALRHNTRDGRLTEIFTLWPDEVRVERREPRGRIRRWRATPQFLRLTLHPRARIQNYLTLGGGGREIELGAFLSPDERLALKHEIEIALARAR
ncbi:MAG: DUF2244 domain-containing protein [Pseudomonadota bacterium]